MKIKYVREDLWVGLYWKTQTRFEDEKGNYKSYMVNTYYLCIIPFLPIIFEGRKHYKKNFLSLMFLTDRTIWESKNEKRKI